MGTIQRLDPPEVQWFANAQFAGVSATPPHAYPTEYPVDQPANLPKCVPGGPSGVAAECARGVEDRLGGCRAKDPMAFEQHAFVYRQLAFRSPVCTETGKAGGPGGLNLVARHPVERQLQSGAIAHRPD